MDEGVAEWEKNLASMIEKTNRDINRLSQRYGCSNANDSYVLSKGLWKRPSVPKTQQRIICNETSSLHSYSLNNSREMSSHTSKALSDRARPISKSVEEDLISKVERSVRYSIEREVDERSAITNRAVDALLKQVETLSKTMKYVDTEVARVSRQTVSKERGFQQMIHELKRRRSDDRVWKNTIESDVSLIKKSLEQQDNYSNKVSSEEMRSTITTTHSSITSTVDSILKLFQSKTDYQFEDIRGRIKSLKDEIDLNNMKAIKNEIPVKEIQKRMQLEMEQKVHTILQKKMESNTDVTKHEILKLIPNEIDFFLRTQMQNDSKSFHPLSETLLSHLLPTIEQKLNFVIEEKLKSTEISNSKYVTVEEIQEKMSLCKDSVKNDMVSLEKELLTKITNESMKLCDEFCLKYVSKFNKQLIEASEWNKKRVIDLEGNITQTIFNNKENEKDIKESMDNKLEDVVLKISHTLNHSNGNIYKHIDAKIFETNEGLSKDFDKINKKLGAMQTICKTLSAGLEMIKSLSDRIQKIEEQVERENNEEILISNVKDLVMEETENMFLLFKSKIEAEVRSSEQKQKDSNKHMIKILEEIQSQLSSKQGDKIEHIILSTTKEGVEESPNSVLNDPSNIKAHVKSTFKADNAKEMSTDNDKNSYSHIENISIMAFDSNSDESYLNVKCEAGKKKNTNSILNVKHDIDEENNRVTVYCEKEGYSSNNIEVGKKCPECKVDESVDAVGLMASSLSSRDFSDSKSCKNRMEVKDNHTSLLGTMNGKLKCEKNDYNNAQRMDEQNHEYSLDGNNRDSITLEGKDCTESDIIDLKKADINVKIGRDCNVFLYSNGPSEKKNPDIKGDLQLNGSNDIIELSNHFSLSFINVPGYITNCDESEAVSYLPLICAHSKEVCDLGEKQHNTVGIDKKDYSDTHESTINHFDTFSASSTEDSDYASDFESENDSDLDLP